MPSTLSPILRAGEDSLILLSHCRAPPHPTGALHDPDPPLLLGLQGPPPTAPTGDAAAGLLEGGHEASVAFSIPLRSPPDPCYEEAV